MRRLALAAVLAFAAACGKSDATSPQSQVPGTYTLRTVNGQGLPFTLQQDGTTKVEVLSDAYTLNGDRTFSQQTSQRVTQGSTVDTANTSDTGTWSLAGTALTVRYASDGTSETGAFSGGNTITVTQSGFVAVYQK